jgi:hypothetical protein
MTIPDQNEPMLYSNVDTPLANDNNKIVLKRIKNTHYSNTQV